jgi:hypothetical protein
MTGIAPRRVRPAAVVFALGLVALASLAAVPAEAQTIHLYACKIVCGFERGNVRLLNDPSPFSSNDRYEDLKPGNYATTCNIYNHDIDLDAQAIFPYLAIEGGGLVFLGGVTIPVLNTAAIGCVDIVGALPPPPPPGFVFEGYLTIFTTDPDFQVDGVRTFESQNGFERHALWSYNPFGPVGLFFSTLGLTIPRLTGPLPLPAGALPTQFMAASGAGGLGLGASIDVDLVPRIDIDLTTDNTTRLPPEVRDAVLGSDGT